MKKQRQFSLKKSKQESEINLSPLIDLIFILLIFFIVTAAIINESGVDADSPDLNTISDSQENEPLVITIQKSGKISSNNKNIPLSNIQSFVNKELHHHSKNVIVIASPEISSERTIKVMDFAYLAGAENVAIRTAR